MKVGCAIWVVKCPQYFHEINESSIQAFSRKFVVVYFDDILINSKSKQEHVNHLTQVMLVLNHEKLFGNLKKFTFFAQEVTSSGYIIAAQGIKVGESKIKVIRSWPVPKSI